MSALKKADAFTERLPNELEVKNAEQLRVILASQLDSKGGAQISIKALGKDTRSVTLAPALARSFMELLRLVSEGQGFRMIPLEANLTTQEAADILNVSRPYLIRLLETNEMPFVKTGRHRRIKAADLFDYKRKRDGERSSALSELAAMDAEGDLT